MTVKLLTEHHLEFLSLKGGCRDSFESTLVKMSNFWKSHVISRYGYQHTKGVFQFILYCVTVFGGLGV